jgi:hypothetical protein
MVSWDADRYAGHLSIRQSGYSRSTEAKLANRYPVDAQHTGRVMSESGIIHDLNGKILLWYLPEVLEASRQVCIRPCGGGYFNNPTTQMIVWRILLTLNKEFAGTIGGPNAPWRVNPANFKDPDVCLPPPGNINLAPAWFQQAHDVREVNRRRAFLLTSGRHQTGRWKFLPPLRGVSPPPWRRG